MKFICMFWKIVEVFLYLKESPVIILIFLSKNMWKLHVCSTMRVQMQYFEWYCIVKNQNLLNVQKITHNISLLPMQYYQLKVYTLIMCLISNDKYIFSIQSTELSMINSLEIGSTFRSILCKNQNAVVTHSHLHSAYFTVC